METLILLVLLVVAAPILVAIALFVRIGRAQTRLDEVSSRLQAVEQELALLKRGTRDESVAPSLSQNSTRAEAVAPQTERPADTPPPLPLPVPAFASPTAPDRDASSQGNPQVPISIPQPPAKPALNWEHFMGVKLFAWLGGFALFLGLAFFVKYSFDNNLVPPWLRVTIGFISGAGLVIGGVLMSRRNYAALSHTLCATGVVVLYSVTFACRSIYHFAFFDTVPTFLCMGAITAVAFTLAIRLNALVVAILGMLGGFLTPILISTGVDNPLALFGYIAILNTGLLLVALNRKWLFLCALAAAGTAAMQIGWASTFFVSGAYFVGGRIYVALAVLLGFNLLYLAGWLLSKRDKAQSLWLPVSICGLAALALAFAGWFLSFASLAQRPWVVFGFIFSITSLVTVIAFVDRRMAAAQPLAGTAAFALLAGWTATTLTSSLLKTALLLYLLFAALHTIAPILLQRGAGKLRISWATQLFPPMALALVLIPIFKFSELSLVIWPFVLAINLLAIIVAVLSAALMPVVVVMVLTLAAIGAAIFKVSENLTGFSTPLVLIGAFAIFFVAASAWLTRKLDQLAGEDGTAGAQDRRRIAGQVPALSAILPFLLLILATLRLPLGNPAPVFGLALLLTVLLMGLSRFFALPLLPTVGLGALFVLECAWHFTRFNQNQPLPTLLWYLGFLALFAIWPFLSRKAEQHDTIACATAAIAGPLQFVLVHRVFATAYPNDMMGLLAIGFSIPALLGVLAILKTEPSGAPGRITNLAWFGGVALFFITLAFPLQFEREWITIGWAFEGAALLWLFHRVPHQGLRVVGVGLLVAAFIRLALNPAVLIYHASTGVPILNWYLYAYGAVIVALFVGARLVAPPRHLVLNANAQALLASLGTVLAFLLVNIEIADFFTPGGSTLIFQFSGHFGRDMTYSIAWALFALLLVVFGIVRKRPAARYAAIALLSVTLLKLFIHDLSQLGALHRIAAFIAVAVVAMLASFAYHRFYAAADRQEPNQT